MKKYCKCQEQIMNWFGLLLIYIMCDKRVLVF